MVLPWRWWTLSRMSDRHRYGGGWYSFERLEVYQLAVEFRRIVKQIVAKIPPGHEEDVDQLSRSAKSTERNICEGGAEYRPREKARFYRMALRSAEESGGSLKILETDVGPDSLYAVAHAVNHKLVAKLKVMCQKRS
jgi:four helix bundle protein